MTMRTLLASKSMSDHRTPIASETRQPVRNMKQARAAMCSSVDAFINACIQGHVIGFLIFFTTLNFFTLR